MKLAQELTHYGTSKYDTKTLYYSSSRTVAQYKKIKMHPMCKLGSYFIKLGLADVPFNLTMIDENAKEIVNAWMEMIWKQLIREGLECLDYGFKVGENIYNKVEMPYLGKDGNQKSFSGIVIDRFKGLDGETIEITIDEYGNLTGFKQDADVYITIEEGKAVVFTNAFESGNFYGESIYEPIYPYWFDSNINRQFMMRWLERKGTGIMKGRYPIGENKDGVDNSATMLTLLDSVIEGVTVSLPSETDEKGNYTWDIAILEPTDRTNAFLEKAKYNDAMILKGMIIPDKALDQGEIGARASVESFQEMFVMRKQDILDRMVESIDKYVVAPFMRINFGKVYYKLRAGQIGDKSKEIAGQIVQKLIEQGKEKVEQQWLIDKTGIPLEDREEVERENLERQQEFQKGMADKKEEDTKEEKPKEEKLAERMPALTKREKKYNLGELDSYLKDRAERFRTDIAEQLNTQKERIKEYIKKKYDPAAYMAMINDVEIRSSKIRALYREFADDVYNYSYELFNKQMGKPLKLSETSQFISMRINLSCDKLINDVQTAVQQSILTDMANGLMVNEVLHNVGEAIDDIINARLTVISETETSYFLGRANDDFFNEINKAVKKGDVAPKNKIVRLQFSAVMDSKTTPLCEKLNGTIVDYDSPIRSKYNCPLHYNAFLAGTKIKTKKEEKNIEDIKVGMLVLTHNNRFKKVTEIMSKHWENGYYEIELENGNILQVTEDHPLLTNKGWKQVKDLTIDDNLFEIKHYCKQCGKEIYPEYMGSKGHGKGIHIREFCNLKCIYEYRKIHRNCEICGKERRNKNKKYCSKKCSSIALRTNKIMYCLKCGKEMKGSWKNPISSKRKYCSNACYKSYNGETSIEKIVREFLENKGVIFKTQIQFSKYIVDFLLPMHNLIIEADGEYWHNKDKYVKIRDNSKDKYLNDIGYKVIRLKEKEIKNNEFEDIINATIN